MMRNHGHFMRLAIEEAKKAEGHTYPNPLVGALIVEDEEVVAKGYHESFGHAHAEINALKSLGRKPADEAVLYVTLEPCSTIGKTPPCTEAIINAGLKYVVIGTIDPNPLHQGRALSILKEAGIDVTSGVLEEKCRRLNEDFNQRIAQQDHVREE
mgnify:CR=1 FL=1